ncbi:hypothetical protein ACLOJK_026702 [Asimina triloba]
MVEREMLADPPNSLLPLGTQRRETSTSPPLWRVTVGQVRDNISLPLSPLQRPPSLLVCLRSGILPLSLSLSGILPLSLSLSAPASSLSPCLSPLRPSPSLPVSLRSGFLPLSLSLFAPALVFKSHPRAYCSSSPAPWIPSEAPVCFTLSRRGASALQQFPPTSSRSSRAPVYRCLFPSLPSPLLYSPSTLSRPIPHLLRPPSLLSLHVSPSPSSLSPTGSHCSKVSFRNFSPPVDYGLVSNLKLATNSDNEYYQ